MKKITLLFLFLSVFMGFSQVPATIDFETASTGAGWNWAVFEGDPANGYNVSTSILANPVSGGINTSATVCEITGDPTNETWGRLGIESGHPAGATVSNPADLSPFSPNATNTYITMKIYQVGFATPVRLKFAGTGNASVGEVEVVNTVADQWVELAINMDIYNGFFEQLDQIIILPSYAARATSHTVYIDDITFGSVPAGDCTNGMQDGDEEGVDCGGSCPTTCPTPAPLVSAPLSSNPETDQIYLYSDVYTNTVNKINFNNATWAVNPPSNIGASTEEIISGTTDNMRYITNIGVAFMPFTQTDASTYDYFHIDIWSDDATFVIVKLEGAGAGLAGDIPVTLTPNQWTGVDIDLNNFGNLSAPANRTTLFQLIIDAAAGKDFYFDNVYFSKTAFTLGTEGFSKAEFKVYPNPTQNSWTVKAQNAQIETINVYDVLGKNVLSLSPNTSETTVNAGSLKAGLYFAQIKTESGINSIKLIKN